MESPVCIDQHQMSAGLITIFLTSTKTEVIGLGCLDESSSSGPPSVCITVTLMRLWSTRGKNLALSKLRDSNEIENGRDKYVCAASATSFFSETLPVQ